MNKLFQSHTSAKIVFSSGLFLVCFTSIVLIGWIAGIEVLTTLGVGTTSVKFNTALIFMIIGITSMLRSSIDLKERKKKLILSLIFLYISFASVIGLQYIFNTNFGIDELFFKDPQAGYSYPGRMAHVTTLYVILHGLANLLLFSRKRTIQFLAVSIFNTLTIFSLVAILGYILELPVFYSLTKYTNMAFVTSVFLGVSSVALSTAVETSLLRRLLFGENLGDAIMRKLMYVLITTIFASSTTAYWGVKYGWFTGMFALAWIGLFFFCVGVVTIFYTAKKLNIIDERRKSAEFELSQSNLDLERKIRIRTQALERSFIQIKRSEESLRSIVNTSPDAFLIINKAGEIKMINDQFTNLTGYTATEAEHLPMKTLWKLQGTVNCVDYLYEKIAANEKVTHVFNEALVYVKGGGEFWGELTFNHLRLNNEELVSISLRDITERKRNEAEMYTLTERLKGATHGTGVGVWDYDILNGKLFWDDNMYELHGVTKETFDTSYDTWERIVHKDDLEKAKNDLFAAFKSDTNLYSSEFRVVRPDGRIVYIRANASLQRDEKGQVIRMIGVNSDFTDKKLFELELVANFERNKIFITQLPTAVAMFDKEMRYLTASNKWYEDYGLQGMEIIGKTHYEVFPDLKDQWKQDHQLVLQGQTLHSDEDFFVREDGTLHWLTWDVRPWYTNTNEVGGVLMFTANITERKRVENLLKFSEERFRGAFESAVIGMAILDTDGNWIKVNSGLCLMLGYDEQEILSMTFKDILDPSDLQVSLALVKEMYDGEREDFQMEHRFIHKNGSEIWTVLAVTLVRDENNKPTQMIAQATDITEQKAAEQNLGKINAKLQGILDASSQVAIISCDLNGIITTFNRGAESLLQYSAEEMVGKCTPAVFHKTEEVEQRSKELSQQFGRPISGFETFSVFATMSDFDSREWTFVKRDGTEFPMILVLTAQRSGTGEPVGYIGVALDITARKQTEETRRQYTVLEAKSKELEQFAYAASHDLREPLLTIKNYVGVLMEDFKDCASPVADKYAQFIDRAVLRMEDLITGLLDYSRLSKVRQAQMVEVKDLLDEVKLDLANLIERNNVQLSIGDMPKLAAYPLELKLLFQNLIANAIKFNKKGEIPKIGISAEKRDSAWQFKVSDNGIGIAATDHLRIFDLFQRLHAKNEFEGTGIGLAQCKKIAEIHNGKIWVESTQGQGSDFYFTIQLSANEN